MGVGDKLSASADFVVTVEVWDARVYIRFALITGYVGEPNFTYLHKHMIFHDSYPDNSPFVQLIGVYLFLCSAKLQDTRVLSRTVSFLLSIWIFKLIYGCCFSPTLTCNETVIIQ